MKPMLAALVAILLATGACFSQQPLEVTQTADAITVAGDRFEATWTRDEAWQLAEASIEDFDGAFRLDARRDEIQGLGAIVIRSGGRTYTARGGVAGEPEITEQTGDLLVFSVEVSPRSADGSECPLTLRQEFTVFGEGAIFCDVTLTGAAEATVDDVEVGMALKTDALQYLRWHWKRTWRGNEDLDRDAGYTTDHYLRVLGVTLGRERPYTNQVEMCLEDATTLAGGREGMWCEVTDDDGQAKRFSWHLGGPVDVAPGFSYKNRFGFAFGHFRTNDNAVGQRIAHWQEGNSALMTYPSDEAIESLADCGVSICVLHLYWYGNPAYTPFDADDMRRWIASCHAKGIKCIVYATPIDAAGIRGINREWISDLGLDGIYFDFGSLHTLSGRGFESTGGAARDFPGLDGVKLTRRFREAVGPEGIIISHSGGYAPDAFFHLNLNAYLPGEAGVQGAMLNDFRGAAYHTGVAYAVAHPWCEYASFQSQHGSATYCAIGGFPHILFGRGTHQDNNYHRSVYRSADFVLPYWQILSAIPMDKETTLYTEASKPAATTDAPDVHCCVYQRSPELLLLTASNLGEGCTPTVTLDSRLLTLSGTYNVLQLSGRDMRTFSARAAGSWSGGSLALPELATNDYIGVLLYKGDLPEQTRGELARIERLTAAFTERRAPRTPAGLTAEASPGVVRLSWEPADDENHIVEYRLYRGTDPANLELLTAVEEEARYSDYVTPAGGTLYYAVSAVDVGGNESPQSPAVRVETPGKAIALDDISPVAGTWFADGPWLRQGTNRKPASPEGDTVTFSPREVQYVRAYFTGGSGNFGCAHIVEMEARDENGQPVRPVKVTSSGDDPGHPASYTTDGNTDRDASAWWSDRNKPMPSWVAFDFETPQTLASVWLLTFWDGTRYYDYAIEVSQDGQEWTPVAGTGATTGPVANARALADVEFADGHASVTTLEFDPQRSGGGLLFRCPDESNGYSLTLEPRWDGNIVLDKLVDGKLKRLAAKFFPFSIHNPIPHRIAVECEGNRIKCYCDEVLVFEVEDDTFASGRAGLIVPSGAQLKFGELIVQPVD